MAVLEVTSRQFRDNQKSFFDLADKGQKIIIRRTNKISYYLTPIEDDFDGDDGFVVTPEMMKKYDRIAQDALNGNCTTCYTVEEAIKHLQSL